MGLYSKIIDLQKLSQVWEKVRSNNPSAGTDQISCAQFDANSRIELKQLNLDFVEQENEILLNNYYFKQLNSLKNM